MSDKKVIQAVETLREVLAPSAVRAERLNEVQAACPIFALSPPDVDCHVAFMCDEIRSHLERGKREKAMRWLGFLQGIAWNAGLASLEDLKHMNMPDPAAKD